jgi:hypothetical protein
LPDVIFPKIHAGEAAAAGRRARRRRAARRRRRADDPPRRKVDYSNAWQEARGLIVARQRRLALGSC